MTYLLTTAVLVAGYAVVFRFYFYGEQVKRLRRQRDEILQQWSSGHRIRGSEDYSIVVELLRLDRNADIDELITRSLKVEVERLKRASDPDYGLSPKERKLASLRRMWKTGGGERRRKAGVPEDEIEADLNAFIQKISDRWDQKEAEERDSELSKGGP